MKIYTKIVLDLDGNTIEEQSYDYDGPVAGAKGQATELDPLGLFSHTQPDPMAQTNMAAGQLGNLNSFIGQNAPGIMAQSTPGTPQENSMFNLESGRYLDKLLPELSGSGLLTSGVGMNAVSHGLSDFTTQFENDRLKQQLAAFTGIGGTIGAPLSPLFGGSANKPSPTQLTSLSTPYGGGSTK